MSEEIENKKMNPSNNDSMSNGNTQIYMTKNNDALDSAVFSGAKHIKMVSSRKLNSQVIEDALEKSSKKSEKELEYIFNERFAYFNEPFPGYEKSENVNHKEENFISSKMYDSIIDIMINKYGGPFTVFTLLDYAIGDESLALIDDIVTDSNFENFDNDEFKEYIQHKKEELISQNDKPNVQRLWLGKQKRLSELIGKAYYSINSNNSMVPNLSLKEIDELVRLNAENHMIQSINDAFDEDLLGYIPNRTSDVSKSKKRFLRFKNVKIKSKFDQIISTHKMNCRDEQAANKKYQQEFLIAIYQNKKEEFLKEISSRRSEKSREELYFDLERKLEKYNDKRKELEVQKADNDDFYNPDLLKECFRLWSDYRIALSNFINKTQEEILENYYSILQTYNPEIVDSERLKCKIGEKDFIINLHTFVEDLNSFVTEVREYENNHKNVQDLKTESPSSAINDENNVHAVSNLTKGKVKNDYSYEDTLMYIEFAKFYGGYSEEEAKLLATVPENLEKFNEYGLSWSKYVEAIKSGIITNEVSYEVFVDNALSKVAVKKATESVYHNDDEFKNDNNHSVDLSGFDISSFDYDFEEPSSVYLPKK